MPTELEKIQHLKQKYQASRRLYTVYERSGEVGRYTFTLIYGTDSKSKAIRYVQAKEEEGLFLIAYCARPQERFSRCVYVTGLQNSLALPGGALTALATSGAVSQPPDASPASANGLRKPAKAARGSKPKPSRVSGGEV